MSVTPLLTRSLLYGGIVAVAVAIVAGTIGWIVSGLPGLLGGLLGAALSALFLGLTAVSILVAGRVTGGDAGNPVFFGIVLGVWVLKLVVFVAAAILLRDFGAVDPVVFFWAVVVAVFGSLVADMVAFARARIPYVSDIDLPGEPPRASRPRPRPSGGASGSRIP